MHLWSCLVEGVRRGSGIGEECGSIDPTGA